MKKLNCKSTFKTISVLSAFFLLSCGSNSGSSSVPDSGITDFKASPVSSAQIDLSWENPATDFDGVLILRDTRPGTDTPADGTPYSAGSALGDSSVVYSSNGNRCNDTGLFSAQKYFYMAYVYNTAYTYRDMSELTATTRWVKSYGSSAPEGINCINRTADGGYIAAGYRAVTSMGNDFWIMKLDSTGKILWKKTFGSAYSDEAKYIEQTNDGGFIVSGKFSNHEAWIIRLDSEGNVLWQKAFGGTGSANDFLIRVRQTADGNFIAGGHTYSFGAGDFDIWIIKLDNNGNILWQKTYGGTSGEYFNSLDLTDDGGCVAAGSTYSFAPGTDCNLWIFKVNSEGSLSWNRSYGTGSYCTAKDIIQTGDEGYAVTGYQNTSTHSNNAIVLRLRNNGSLQWSKRYYHFDPDVAYSIKETPGNGFIVAGNTESYGAGLCDLMLIKIDNNGNVSWQKTYGGSNNDFFESVICVEDGGFVLSGRTASFGMGSTDAWILNVSSSGLVDYGHGCYLSQEDLTLTQYLTLINRVEIHDSDAIVADTTAIIGSPNSVVVSQY